MMFSTILALTALSAPMDVSTDKMTGDVAATQTRAEEIAARFGTSFAANRDNVIGWYSGRCYTMQNPNTAVGNLLVTETRTAPGNEGPIFDRPVTKFFVVGRGQNGAQANPEYFDNMTAAQMAEVQQWIDVNFPNPAWGEAYVDQNANTFTTVSGNIRFDARSDVQFSYVRATSLNNNSPFAYCYFFKKVQ